ncbi:MAG: LysM peptidoglycan-binding domain-containing protein [Deltaproteobacteria bacterium]|nr:LysM peptidoglycan-binding domain-containing protein [Deltaproteobacteria bacterium]
MPHPKFYCRTLITAVCAIPLLCSCAAYQQTASGSLSRPVTKITRTIAVPEVQSQAQVDDETPPEPEQTAAQEVKDLDTLGPWDENAASPPPKTKKLYDFPVTINRQVRYYINFFQHKNSASFRRWLVRSGRYLPMIKSQLRASGLPEDLAYLPMIESGYSLTAYSRARAVGPWQFIRSTALNYGLTVNHYEDDRRDPLKSTQAACRYLADLYGQFKSWPLAVAAYNAGEGKIARAVRMYKTHDFWEIARHSYLTVETKRYVPKLTAAIIIATNPEKYGFRNLQYDRPLSYDTVEVPPWTSLHAIALACGSDFKTIRRLNQHLRRAITPPSMDSEVKVPLGKKKILAANLPRVVAATSTHFKIHVIRRHDTVGKICRQYRISLTTLLKANNLHKAKLTPGRHLRIPYRETKYTLLSRREYAQRQRLVHAGRDPNIIIHRVRAGETVSTIAEHYHTQSHMIASWNGLHSINKIRAGQKLVIHLTGAGNNSIRYYNVQGGDSLWTIAQKFNTNTDNIKRWNNLKNNLIHPGLKLILKNNEG